MVIYSTNVYSASKALSAAAIASATRSHHESNSGSGVCVSGCESIYCTDCLKPSAIEVVQIKSGTRRFIFELSKTTVAALSPSSSPRKS